MDCSEMKIVIVAQDSDFFQLITDRVNVLRYRGDKTVMCDVAYIREKLGVEPAQYAEYKSLTGDNADNIRGAEKVGPKTAAALMKEFGSLERMLLQVQEIKTPSVRQSIMKDADRLRKNYQLIALSGAEKLPFSRERMVFEDRGMTTTDVLRGIGLRKEIHDRRK